MSDATIAVIETSTQKTNEILRAIQEDLALTDRQHAYQALRAFLHSLRDRLTVDQTANFSSQLPLVMRGILYEGWKPAATPVKWNKDEFLDAFSERYATEFQSNPAELAQGVWRILSLQITQGQADSLKHDLPGDIVEFLEAGEQK